MIALPLRTKFNKTEWQVRRVSQYIASGMIERYHYAKSASSWSVYTFGLFLNGDPNVWGVTWWLPPTKLAVDKFNPGGYKTSLILHRMVLHPLVPRNGASFLLAGSVRQISGVGRHDFLITYADTWKGHDGTVYKASNWTYRGMSDPTQVWLDSDGILTSAYNDGRKRNKIQMEALGCQLLGYYPKHIYSLAIKRKRQLRQLRLGLVA